ncbi:pelargonidin 3-o-(6-caffeoylglucoside) 5-o-(6-o-malonylglucoside) 4'''-malonyltransferase [Phtheirospermum japonicum]|uniref:Pelargonidin 3-o-(6-caffeoylglucoside) 5-o-(6-o-malonylglucoside) 4'''-malonyltransferase n=1 Tax=Phtheirospermum japonicum TaxID=374723 RepID=A0A830BGD5_9LAMI|nr:pelargonidin 3-o-(6-caffeoylglucoside) 5-o-(6-o-malonylglucoside) 4'''-malonyltransferase [Phtheirospermum japonicum]
MKVNVISRKLVKPLTPTPQNLYKYKISFTDELIPPAHTNVILFYKLPNPKQKPTTQLQESLAKILPQFYVFAGRYIKKDHMVNCNDEGAEFVEAEANDIELMDFIANIKNNDQLDNLVSRQPYDVDKATDPLLSIQITQFKCGGLSISVSLSHRVADACSMATFIAAWSNNNNNNNPEPIIPSFDCPSLLPGINFEYDLIKPLPNIVVKRLLFTKEAISSLRSKLRSPNNFVSRVRLVTALIAKALIGVEIAKSGKSRACFIGQAVNLRGRTIKSLPKHSCGNLVVESLTQRMSANEIKEIGLQELVYILGDAIDKTIEDCANIFSLDQERLNKILKDPWDKIFENIDSDGVSNALFFSDWTKFGFYESDFGWGNKPVWVGTGTAFCENLTFLLGSKEGDGIEAWVSLEKNDVAYFEQDEDMRLFTIA